MSFRLILYNDFHSFLQTVSPSVAKNKKHKKQNHAKHFVGKGFKIDVKSVPLLMTHWAKQWNPKVMHPWYIFLLQYIYYIYVQIPLLSYSIRYVMVVDRV